MRCYTLVVGSVSGVDTTTGESTGVVSKEKIPVHMVPEQQVPCVVLGSVEDGKVIPMDEVWFNRLVELQQQVLQLPDHELEKVNWINHSELSLPELLRCEVTDINEQKTAFKLVMPVEERDYRALVHIIPPPGEKVTYTSLYKIEELDNHSNGVVRRHLKLEEGVVGVELLAEHRGEALIIMHPGAGIKAHRAHGLKPREYSYLLRLYPHQRGHKREYEGVIDLDQTPRKNRNKAA